MLGCTIYGHQFLIIHKQTYGRCTDEDDSRRGQLVNFHI